MFQVKNVSCQNLFRPATSVPGQIFEGFLIKGELHDGFGRSKPVSFSFKYEHPTRDYVEVANEVGHAIYFDEGQAGLPTGVKDLRVQGL